jgi:hypothetical protein
MREYTIYLHRLKRDNRVYIGITKQELTKRWQNGLGYIRSSYFYNAIKKYGWKSFEHIVLFKNLTREEAQEKEKELIKIFSSNLKEYGFNISEGGFAPIITEEQKIKISNSEKGKKISRKTIEKANATKRKRYLEHGLTDKQKEHYKNMIKPIVCIETNKVYYGHKELKKDNFIPNSVYLVCRGIRKTASGYHWKYYVKE